MSTSLQLIPAYLDSKPVDWRRDYVKNMRSIRGYPTYWRIRDDEAYMDGPPTLGAYYTRDPYTWQVRIVKDAAGNNTDTIELYNLAEQLSVTTEQASDTVYNYAQTHVGPALTYTHTDIVQSVSLEFDQSGRQLISFESDGEIFLIWYDPQAEAVVTTNWGAGSTPVIVTDTYRRTRTSQESERLLFYVGPTKQLFYRRQVERFQIEHALPNVPQGVVELLKVSKNLYGGLTVLYAYSQTPGELLTGSFTARAASNTAAINTDGTLDEPLSLSGVAGELADFTLKYARIDAPGRSNVSLTSSAGDMLDFMIRSSIIRTQHYSALGLQSTAGAVADFQLRSSVRSVVGAGSATISSTQGTLLDFKLKQTLIDVRSTVSAVDMTSTAGELIDFILG